MPAQPATGRRERRNRPADARTRPARGPGGRAGALWRSLLGPRHGDRRAAPRRLADAVADPAQLPAAGRAGRRLLRDRLRRRRGPPAALGLSRSSRPPRRRLRRNATWAAAALAAAVVVAFSWRAAEWQNSIRERVDMPPVHTGHPLEVMAIAAVVALVLILRRPAVPLGGAPSSRRWLARHVPERISQVVGLVVAVLLFWGIVDGVLLRAFFNAADELFATRDALLEPEHPAPTDPLGTGSAASLVDWEALGRAGREFVASGPTAEAIAAFTGRPAVRPLRVYVGLNSADDRRGPRRARARRDDPRRRLRPRGARRHGADRHRLDGPGGDGHARVSARRRHRDRRRCSIPICTSWISLLVEPGFGTETGRALFHAVYRHWTALPRDARPRLYLHGLSASAPTARSSRRGCTR